MCEGPTLVALVHVAIAVLALGCGASEPPQHTPVAASSQIFENASSGGSETAMPFPASSDSAPPVIAPVASQTPPIAPPSVSIGAMYVMGDRHETPSDFAISSVGEPIAEPPPDATHALPRVVIDVPKSNGSIKKAAVESHARSEFWGKVIACYRPGAVKDQSLRGETTLRVTIAKGEVRGAKVISPMPDKSVSACLAKDLRGLKMPAGRSTATMTIHVAPGDDPMSPTDDQITRGPGKPDLDRLRGAVIAALPALSECYRSARLYTPDLRGWLSIRIQVAPDGKLSEAFESGTHFPDERVSRCALRVVRKLETDPPKGGSVRVFVPISLGMSGASPSPSN